MPPKSKKPPRPSPPSPIDRAAAEVAQELGTRARLLVGVSGGRDSVVLLHALRRAGFARLVVCHFDHALRGAESRRDAAFVRRLAARLDCTFIAARWERDGDRRCAPSEADARAARYAFFEHCARQSRCVRLALAHHADDQVETCMLNFLRGSGAAGLAGMRRVSTRGRLTIYRPFLGVTRCEIAADARERKIRHCEDSTNSATHATRNFLRHQILPQLRERWGGACDSAILRAADLLRDDHLALEALTPDLEERPACRDLLALSPALQRRAVHRWLRGQGLAEPGYAEVMRVLSLLDIASGPAKVNLPSGWHARRSRGVIFIERT